MTAFLAGLDLRDRDVLVVGGGPVAERRAGAALTAGAKVRLVAPAVTEQLSAWSAAGKLALEAREVVEPDVEGAWLVLTCTGDAATDAAVAGWAESRRTFCVVASDAEAGTARIPATADVAGLKLGVLSTGDADPRRVTAVRDTLVETVLAGTPDLRPVREDANALDTLQPGEVALVGGGTGDPALMTLRARTLLSQADVVVTDRLGPVSVLDELRDDVRVISVGKAKGAAPVSQTQIEQILVTEAQAGNRVVRLKGGDPYLFGRGGEEMLACRAAGVPVRAVPGITSAVAAAESAGIPVTHRGTSDRVLVVNGHWPFTDLDLAALRRPDVTVVVLMGIDTLDRLTKQALEDGVDPAKPAAIVASATLPGQRVLRAPLGELAAACAAEGIKAPGVVVLGDVAREGFLDPASPGRAVALPTREQRRAAQAG